MSQQNGLDHDGTEPTGSSKSDDEDGVQKKSENVAHAQDGIKLSKLKNSGPLAEFATDTRCLQYRERPYDDKGLVVGNPGEWKPLTVNIEGFSHREGVRNVLRVKQFKGPAFAGGAPSKLYVLDLVIESEAVKP